MIEKYLPDMYYKDIYSVNYKKLKEKGIKCILVDLDNTISPAKEEIFYDELKLLFDILKKDFKIILFSNNFKKRVSKIANYYDIDCEYLSLKPFPFKYKKILRKYNFKASEIATIGDQIMTDIKGGKKVKIYTILVEPVSEIDEKETFINRQIEKYILKKFAEKDIFKKGRYYE